MCQRCGEKCTALAHVRELCFTLLQLMASTLFGMSAGVFFPPYLTVSPLLPAVLFLFFFSKQVQLSFNNLLVAYHILTCSHMFGSRRRYDRCIFLTCSCRLNVTFDALTAERNRKDFLFCLQIGTLRLNEFQAVM